MTNDFPPPNGPSGYGQPQPPLQQSDERLWMTLVDVGGIFFFFIPSLIAYLVLKDRSDYVRRNAAGAFNFQLTMTIAYIVGWLLAVVLIGFLLVAAVVVVNVIFSVIAAIAANKGQDYRYPLQIPVFK